MVLQKSIDFIQHLSKQKKGQENDLTSLRKEVVALQIMRANYEQLVRAHQRAPQIPDNLVPDEVKFQVCRILAWNCLTKYFVSGLPGVHGLPLPVVQPAGVDEQLRRVVGVRVLLDRGAVQAR